MKDWEQNVLLIKPSYRAEMWPLRAIEVDAQSFSY